MAAKCKHCGANLPPESKFCSNCGGPVYEAQNRHAEPEWRTFQRAETGWQVSGADEEATKQTATTTSLASKINAVPPIKGAAWCLLCDRYVTPQKRWAAIPFILGTTAIIGTGVSVWFDSTLVENGKYTSLAGVTLSALLNFGVIVFLILALAAFVSSIYLRVQPKRCPLCNSRF